MLTQSMPAVIRALQGVLPPAAVKQLTQALGNCNQPLTHRGAVNLQPATPRQSGPGTYGGGQWSVNEYGDLIQQNSQSFYDMADYSSNWNSYNYSGDSFHFPTTQNFNVVNNFSSGGTNLGGETTVERIFTREIVFLGPPGADGVDGIDGRDGREGLPGLAGQDGADGLAGAAGAAGAAGPPGARGAGGGGGAAGRPGAPGAAGRGGRDGGAGRNGRDGLPGLPGLFGRDGRDGKDGKADIVRSIILNYLSGANPRVAETKQDITYPTNAIKDVTVSGLSAYTTDTLTIPTNAISAGTAKVSLPQDACSDGTVTLPAGIPTNAISGGAVTVQVPTNAISGGLVAVLMPDDGKFVKNVKSYYDKTTGIDLTNLQVSGATQPLLTGGSITIELAVTTASVNNVSGVQFNPESCSVTVSSNVVNVVTSVSVKTATFTPQTVDPGDLQVTGSVTPTYSSTLAESTSIEYSQFATGTYSLIGTAATTSSVSGTFTPTAASLTDTTATFSPTAASFSEEEITLTGTAATTEEVTYVSGVTTSDLATTPVAADTKTEAVLTKAQLEGVVRLAARVATP
jgi:hypothetical protein